MRVGLIVDSACDLPHDFVKENNIYILPVTITIDGHTIVDDHDPDTTREFQQSGLMEKGHTAETQAFTEEQIRDLFLEEIVTQYDFAFLETIARSRSQIFDNAEAAMNRIMRDYRPKRHAAGRKGAFSMRVVDSGTMFGGQGVLAAHTVHLINQGIGKAELRTRVNQMRDNIYGCLVPKDLYYIRARGRQRGDKTLPWLSTFLAKTLGIFPVIWGRGSEGGAVAKERSFEAAIDTMFSYGVKRVREGLLSPYVCVSYGIPDEEFEQLPGVARLREACEQNNVTLLCCRGGITSGIYVGPESIGLALAAPSHEFTTDS